MKAHKAFCAMGRIAGVGNGNPLSLEPFGADYRKLFFGKAMLIVGADPGEGGTITVKAQTEGAATAKVVLKSK
jgi:beta-galactosidase